MMVKGGFFMAAQPVYNGSVLRSGSSGPDVALVQRWLNGLHSRWPSIGGLTVDGLNRFEITYNRTGCSTAEDCGIQTVTYCRFRCNFHIFSTFLRIFVHNIYCTD